MKMLAIIFPFDMSEARRHQDLRDANPRIEISAQITLVVQAAFGWSPRAPSRAKTIAPRPKEVNNHVRKSLYTNSPFFVRP